MCYLCLEGNNNPFGMRDMSRASTEDKKSRAKEIKQALQSLELNVGYNVCQKASEEIAKLKAEQYQLARDI